MLAGGQLGGLFILCMFYFKVETNVGTCFTRRSILVPRGYQGHPVGSWEDFCISGCPSGGIIFFFYSWGVGWVVVRVHRSVPHIVPHIVPHGVPHGGLGGIPHGVPHIVPHGVPHDIPHGVQ